MNENDKLFGVDTVMLKSESESLINPDEVIGVTKYYSRKDRHFYRLNADSVIGDTVESFSDFKLILETIFDEIEPTNPKISRVDFRFDDYKHSFKDNYKMTKLLVLLTANEMGLMKNIYESRNPVSFEKLSIRAQNKRLEIECYDKEAQEPNGNVKTRLEFRSKSLNIADTDKLKSEFYRWVEILETAIKSDNVQFTLNKLNTNLYKEFMSEFGGSKSAVDKFIFSHADDIFTSKQLTTLLEKIGCFKSPERKSKRLKAANNIEFVSKTQMKKFLAEVKKQGSIYFD